jgi:hypothetical protein
VLLRRSPLRRRPSRRRPLRAWGSRDAKDGFFIAKFLVNEPSRAFQNRQGVGWQFGVVLIYETIKDILDNELLNISSVGSAKIPQKGTYSHE